MKRYQQLLQERADLVAEGQKIFDAAEQANRDLTAEEATRDDEINARLETIAAELQREEVRRERERTVAAVPSDPRVTGLHDRREDDPRASFTNLADFALAVKAASRPGGTVDERLRIGAAPTNYHYETGSDEGYMVPPQMRDEIWALVHDGQDLLNLVEPEPTISNSVELLADETTPWGSTGIQARWRSEGSQMTPSKLDTDKRSVPVHQLYAFVLATDELLADAPRLNARLTKGSADAIRYKASDSIMRGTGAGQPVGFLNSGCLVTVSKESGQAAATIVTKNVSKMFSRLLPGGLSRSVWLANSDILPQLMELSIGNQPVYTPPNAGFRDAPGGFLLGRPLVFQEHSSTLGTIGDLAIIDPAGYYAVQRDTLQAASSIHLYFDYAIQAFRWTFRFGGQPFLSAAVSPDNGSNTKSHFVVLETRS